MLVRPGGFLSAAVPSALRRAFCLFADCYATIPYLSSVEHQNSDRSETDSIGVERREPRDRLEAVETRVAAFESVAPRHTSSGDFWGVDGIESLNRSNAPNETSLGSVVFGGSVCLGPRVLLPVGARR